MRLLLLPAALLLAACQAPNPYHDDGRPLPPAPAEAAGHFDRSGYPATPPDYSRYRSWQWREPALGDGGLDGPTLAGLVSAGLDQRGLRPVQGEHSADLLVSARLHSERRQYSRYESVGGHAGYGYGGYPYDRYGSRYGAYGEVPLVRTYERKVSVLQLELFDGRSGQLLWRGQAVSDSPDRPDAREQALRRALEQTLDAWPPR